MGNAGVEVDQAIATRLRGATDGWKNPSKLETARRADIPWTTFDRKLRVGSFTIRELYRIADALQLAPETLLPEPAAVA